MGTADNEVSGFVEVFYDSHPYPAMGKSGMFAYVKMKRHLLQSLGIPLSYLKGTSILEAACGTGESTLAFATLGPSRVVGVDIASESIKLANELKLELRLPDVQFVHRDIQQLGDLGGQFDLVMCEVLHQTPDPLATLRHLVDYVRPGGYIILAVANRWGNLGDAMRYKIVSMIGGADPDRRIAVAKKLFFNPIAMRGRVRGLRKREIIHLDNVISDIYGHPYRATYTARQVLDWLNQAGLEYHGSNPELGTGGGTPWTRLGAQLQMLRRNMFQLEIAAIRPPASGE